MKRATLCLLLLSMLVTTMAQQRHFAPGHLIIEANPNQKISIETFSNILSNNEIEELRYLGFTNYYLLKVKRHLNLDSLIKALAIARVAATKDEIFPLESKGTIEVNDANSDMGYWNSTNQNAFPAKNCMDSLLAFLPPAYKNNADDSVEKVTFVHTEIPRLTHFDMPLIDSFRSVDMLRGGIPIDTFYTTPHGSWTAGCGFAKWDNSNAALDFDGGMTGMSNNRRPIIINIADSGFAYSSAAIPMLHFCFNYCQQYPDKRLVVSYSFGGAEMPQPIAAQIDAQNQILLMHSAGNSNVAAYNNVDAFQLNVMATNSNGKKAGFSNYGQHVDIAFQGAGVKGLSPASDQAIDSWQGTSASAPCAAGFLVTLWNLMPEKTASEMKAMLKDRMNTTCFVTQPDSSPPVPNIRLWHLLGNQLFPLVKQFPNAVNSKTTPVVDLNGLVNDLIHTQVDRKFYVQRAGKWQELVNGMASLREMPSGKRLIKYAWKNNQTIGQDGECTSSELVRQIEIFNTKPMFDTSVTYCSNQAAFKIKLNNCPDSNALDSFSIIQQNVDITHTFNRSDSSFTITPGGASALQVKVKYFLKSNREIADSTVVMIRSTAIARNLTGVIHYPSIKACEGPITNFNASTNSLYNNFQWQKNGFPVGNDAPYYIDSSLANGDQVRCEIKPMNGCWNTTSFSSNNLVVTVPPCYDNFNQSSVGKTNAISYGSNACDAEAVMTRNSTTDGLLNSFIKYDAALIPRQGTIELLLQVNSGSTSTGISTTTATVFAIQNNAFNWLGSGCFLTVYSNGNINLRQFDQAGGFTNLTATPTPFRFNEKHIIGISFGSQGMKIAVDGVVRATNTTALGMNKGMGIVGGIIDPLFSGSAWYQFTGLVDKFRISYQQSDFQLSKDCNSYVFNGNGNWSVSSNWKNGLMPPAILPNGSEVIIDGQPAGESIVDRQQIIENGATIIIKQGKKMRVPGNVIIQ